MRRIITGQPIRALAAATDWAWRNRAKLATGIEATLDSETPSPTRTAHRHLISPTR
jgi:hypothetical protein